MCKLIAMTNIPTIKHSKMNALLVQAAKLLGSSQKDGLGIGVVSQDNSVYRERHIDPDTFNGLGSAAYTANCLPKGIRTKIKQNVDFDSSGQYPDLSKSRSIIMHGRTATAPAGINNTHPFVKYDERLGGSWMIAHNGVVEWEGKTTLPLETTCDSEHILNCYAYLDGENSFASNISGYAAVVGFNPKGELFVYRDDRAPLYISYHTKNAFTIVATDPAHCEALMETMCKATKAKVSQATEPVKLDDNTSHLWDLDKLEIVSNQVEPFDKGYGRINSTYVSRSLGYASSSSDYSYGGSSYYNPYVKSDPVKTTTSCSTPKIDHSKTQQTEIWRLTDIDTAIQNIEANESAYDEQTLSYIRTVKNRRKALAAMMRTEGRCESSWLTDRDQKFLFGKLIGSTPFDVLAEETSLASDQPGETTDLDFLSDADWQRRKDTPSA